MTQMRGATYGWKNGDLDEAAARTEALLTIELEPRHSSFRGGDYYNWDGPDSGEIIVQRNFEDEEGELDEADYPEHLVLLYASGLPDELYERLGGLPGLDLLESHSYPLPEA
jgi:hypothetical protein